MNHELFLCITVHIVYWSNLFKTNQSENFLKIYVYEEHSVLKFIWFLANVYKQILVVIIGDYCNYIKLISVIEKTFLVYYGYKVLKIYVLKT